MDNKFLAINKKYFNLGLKSIDIMILAQIDEFSRNNCECYITNQQLSDMFGESVRTIARSLNKLEELKFIIRNTITSKDNGKASKIRTMKINYDIINASVKTTLPLHASTKKEVPKIKEGSAKSLISKGQNGIIKDKKKENKKDNYYEKEKNKIISLHGIDDFIDILNKKNISYTKEEIIDSYNEVHSSNLVKEYKWNCEDLGQFIYSNKEYNGKSFSDILKSYEDFVTEMLSHGYM